MAKISIYILNSLELHRSTKYGVHREGEGEGERVTGVSRPPINTSKKDSAMHFLSNSETPLSQTRHALLFICMHTYHPENTNLKDRTEKVEAAFQFQAPMEVISRAYSAMAIPAKQTENEWIDITSSPRDKTRPKTYPPRSPKSFAHCSYSFNPSRLTLGRIENKEASKSVNLMGGIWSIGV